MTRERPWRLRHSNRKSRRQVPKPQPDQYAIKDRPISELSEHPENPRTITDQRLADLAKSLKASPEMLRARPLIALTNGQVIAGNQRLKAAQQLGWTTIPCVTVDLDATEARLWVLRDNSPYGEWEEAALGEMLKALEDDGADLGLTGFGEKEVGSLLDSFEKDNGGSSSSSGGSSGDDDERVPTKPQNPTSVAGEIYELGDHRLICGDSTDPEVLKALFADLEGHQADCIWTDPPYGVSYVSRGAEDKHEKIDNDEKSASELEDFLTDSYKAAEPHIKPGSGIYIAHPSGPRMGAFFAACQRAGWKWREDLVWVKNQLVLGRRDYHAKDEPVTYATAGDEPAPGYDEAPGRIMYTRAPAEKGRFGRFGERWYGEHNATSVFYHNKPRSSDDHPTMKPPGLIEEMIRNSCPRGGVVLDFFAGSGSTMIAAHNASRVAYMVELDPGYCDVIRRRYAELAGEAQTTADELLGETDEYPESEA